MEQAFKPLGVYLDFWHPMLAAGEQHDFHIAMVNDEDRRRTGKLRLSFINDAGKEVAGDEVPFSIEPLGAETYTITMNAPDVTGSYSLRALATPVDDTRNPTISHRDVVLNAGAAQ
jgi:hypothetical protein